MRWQNSCNPSGSYTHENKRPGMRVFFYVNWCSALQHTTKSALVHVCVPFVRTSTDLFSLFGRLLFTLFDYKRAAQTENCCLYTGQHKRPGRTTNDSARKSTPRQWWYNSNNKVQSGDRRSIYIWCAMVVVRREAFACFCMCMANEMFTNKANKSGNNDSRTRDLRP